MPRDVNGDYTLPLADVVSGTTIQATWANTTMSDLETAMSDSLSRSGDGGLTAELQLVNGVVAQPAITFINQTNTGLYRAGASDMRVTLNGVDITRFFLKSAVPTVAVTGDIDLSGTATVTGDVALYDDVNVSTATLTHEDESATPTTKITNPDGPVNITAGAQTFQAKTDGNFTIPATSVGATTDAVNVGVGDGRYAKIFAEGVFNVSTGDNCTSIYNRGFGTITNQTDGAGRPYYDIALDESTAGKNVLVQITIDFTFYNPSSQFTKGFIVQGSIIGNTNLIFKAFDGFGAGDVVTGESYRIRVMITESVGI